MIRVTSTRKLDRTDVLILFADEAPKDQKPVHRFDALSGDTSRRLSAALDRENFKARVGQTFVWHAGDARAERVLVAGLGRASQRDVDHVIRAAGAAARKAREIGAASVAVSLPVPGKLTEEKNAQSVAEGLLLGAYEFEKYRQPRESGKPVERFEIVGAPERALKTAEIYARATCFARDLVNTPPGDMAPRHLADAARRIAGPGVKVTVWGPKEIEKKGMGGLIGIGKGSTEPYQFIMLKWEGRKSNKKVALVGKGITFDSGGLCIKTAEGMNTMKCDMSGAAAVLGAFSAIAELKPDCAVYGYIPAAENMLGGNAVKTGDVLRTASGRTIEVNNTDAEGRVVLADALTVAREDKPDEIIDLATLTGACVVALGDQLAGLFSNDENLAAGLVAAGRRAGERFWPMPLVPEYRELLKSDIADIKNSGGRYAGAITGALFLQEWAGDQPWAHLDIAGPAFNEKGLPHCPPGGVGFAVRTLLEYVTAQGK